MKKVFSSILMAFVAGHLLAAPAEKCKKIISLLDGTSVEVTVWGDENGCFYMDQKGRMYEPVGTGSYFRSVDYSVDEAVQRVVSRKRMAARIGANLPTKGTYKIPVVLVQFKDKAFSVPGQPADIAAFYDKYCNGTRNGVNYTGAGSYGAVRDYFIAQSDSTLFWDFDVIGPVTLDRELAYYGQDMDGQIDVNISSFYKESLAKAKEMRPDWSVYDSNADGKVDMVFFIYAGLGQANGGEPHTIWPKEVHREMNIDGVTFAVSACCNELRPKKKNGTIVGTQTDGIGIMCHEMSHVLGLPDFYNPSHQSFGMDYWSVMDYGYFAQNGYAPGAYNGYERDFMGWRRLVELDRPQTVHMASLEDGGVAYKIVNEQNPDEYYVLHNLQPKGWDASLSRLGHGLLVTHVDYSKQAWDSNKVNTDVNHQRMTIIPANNKLIGNFSAENAEQLLDALAGHPYPGKTGNTQLTDKSVPAAQVFQGSFMNKPIVDIEENKGVISFKYMPLGVLDKPDLSGAKETGIPFGMQITWPAVPHAEAYCLEYTLATDLNHDLAVRIDTVRNNTVTLEHLKEGESYQYRVRAMADTYENSSFSEWKVAQLSVNSIQEVLKDEDAVEVYSVQGVKLLHTTLADARRQLPKGLYVVKSAVFNGKLYLK